MMRYVKQIINFVFCILTLWKVEMSYSTSISTNVSVVIKKSINLSKYMSVFCSWYSSLCSYFKDLLCNCVH